MEMYRQGDILLKSIEIIPSEATEIEDRILAYGETTEHKHQLIGSVRVRQHQQQKYIEVEEDVEESKKTK